MKSAKRCILVTGGAGFIGGHLARRLVALGHQVIIVDNLSTGQEENIPWGVDFINFDISDINSFGALDKYQFDAVFHLAGQSSGALSFVDPFADFQSHVLTTFNLLTWGKDNNKFKRFLYASSTTVYGDPITMPVSERHPVNPKTYYAAGKLAAESYINFFNNQGIRSTVFRMPNVYGPGQNLVNKDQGMISIYLSYMLDNKPILVKGSPDRFRDFIYIDDVVDAWVRSLENEITHGHVYNLGTGKRTTVGLVLTYLQAAFKQKDYPVSFAEGTPGDQTGFVCDNKALCEHLGWTPSVDISQGIEAMAAYEMRRKINAK